MRAFFCLLFCALASARLRVTLESDTYQLERQTESFLISVTLKSDFLTPITLLKWDSPLDDATDVFRGDMFEIRHSSGERAVYTGIIMKRNPVLSDFVTMNPGQSTTVVLDLFKGYEFPLEGEYKVMLATVVEMEEGELEGDSILASYTTFTPIPVESAPLDVNVVSVKPARIWKAPMMNLTGPSGFHGCDSSQTSQVRTSGTNAVSAALQGYNYLPSTACPSGKPIYTEWFGACTSGRYSTVRNALSAIHSGLNANWIANCGGSSCSPNTYAYVFPADTNHNIYLCGYFWKVTSNNCVLDSQPGTLIHEMGHFNNVARLADVTYGVTNCRTLARNEPDNAIRNADNYCFYTDSCPR